MRISRGQVAGAGFVAGLSVCLLAGAGRADPADGVQVHGFVSQGALLSTGNDYLAHSRRGSVEFFEAGLNVSKEVADGLRVGMQLFARDLGPIGNYAAKVDWAYLDYLWRPWLGVRAGRIKLPFGLYNEYSDVDSARLSILLPQSVYPITDRDYLLAQTGFSLYGSQRLGFLGALDYQLAGGTIFLDRADNPAVDEIDSQYVVAGQLFWRTPLTGLRLGANVMTLGLELEFTLPAAQVEAYKMAMLVGPDYDGKVRLDLEDLIMMMGSLEYAAHGWLVAAEYGRWTGDLILVPSLGLPPQKVNEERFYGMLAYRFTDWFEAGSYYSVNHKDVDDRKGRNSDPSHRAYQRDLAVTVRFDINEHWLFKLEAHYLVGTTDLQSSDVANTGELAREWGLFLVKTTVSF
jgi:hypothetical protein